MKFSLTHQLKATHEAQNSVVLHCRIYKLVIVVVLVVLEKCDGGGRNPGSINLKRERDTEEGVRVHRFLI